MHARLVGAWPRTRSCQQCSYSDLFGSVALPPRLTLEKQNELAPVSGPTALQTSGTGAGLPLRGTRRRDQDHQRDENRDPGPQPCSTIEMSISNALKDLPKIDEDALSGILWRINATMPPRIVEGGHLALRETIDARQLVCYALQLAGQAPTQHRAMSKECQQRSRPAKKHSARVQLFRRRCHGDQRHYCKYGVEALSSMPWRPTAILTVLSRSLQQHSPIQKLLPKMF